MPMCKSGPFCARVDLAASHRFGAPETLQNYRAAFRIMVFFLFFFFFPEGESDGKTDFAPIFEVCPAQQRVENSAFSRQKKKTAFLRSFGLRYSPTFSPMAIPFWDGHAWEGFSSLPGFCLAISIPPSENQTPKWRFSRHFLAGRSGFFHLPVSRKQIV